MPQSPRSLTLYCAGAFLAGACTTRVVSPERDATATPGGNIGAEATVVELRAAPTAVAPSGKAKVTVLARGAQAFVGELTIAEGAAVPEHADATEEFIHVLEGSGTITIDGQVSTVGVGTTVFMPAGAVVAFRNGDAPLRAIQVFADPDPASKYDDWAWTRP